MNRNAAKTSVVLAIVLLTSIFASQAAAAGLAPPKGKVFLGTSDRGTAKAFEAFTAQTGKHPALLNTFHRWGFKLNRAYERWRATKTRPILSISTVKTEEKIVNGKMVEIQKELITPEQIALGAGDDYLLDLNEFFAKHGLQAYVRPLGEPNRCRNLWSAVTCTGKLKGGEHSTFWYKQAFRRISTIVRGGATAAQVNATLAGIGLPPLSGKARPVPAVLPTAPVAIVWNPLALGSPKAEGNYPGNYWPGSRWVGFVGTDFYPDQKWEDLERFFNRRYWNDKIFALTEWGVVGKDDPTFAKKVVAWTLKRPRVRILTYYTGASPGETNYDLENYPNTKKTLRQLFQLPNFLAYAEPNAGDLPPLSP